jgi:hypothetical protein
LKDLIKKAAKSLIQASDIAYESTGNIDSTKDKTKKNPQDKKQKAKEEYFGSEKTFKIYSIM